MFESNGQQVFKNLLKRYIDVNRYIEKTIEAHNP
jgi:hypothetical protein